MARGKTLRSSNGRFAGSTRGFGSRVKKNIRHGKQVKAYNKSMKKQNQTMYQGGVGHGYRKLVQTPAMRRKVTRNGMLAAGVVGMTATPILSGVAGQYAMRSTLNNQFSRHGTKATRGQMLAHQKDVNAKINAMPVKRRINFRSRIAA